MSSQLRNVNLNALLRRQPLPAPRVVPTPSAEAERIVREETQAADAMVAVTDSILDSTPHGEHIPAGSPKQTETNISESDDKLSRLVDDDFPFDESQLTAVYGLIKEQYGCLIGAAGTGKTTVTKKFVDLLRDGVGDVDMSQYWKRGTSSDADDDYEIPERLIPAICCVSFTGRASQMTKKNFPRDWHGNIMTIHRALGFYPEFYEDFDPESEQMVRKRRFVPAYTADNKMPWKIIVIDEAGMLGLELWHQLFAACEDDTRIYMIGDINQLQPTHGKSILGFAMANWPVYELTHVHRQQGANNSIVDNAHRVLKGLRPVSDYPEKISANDVKSLQAGLGFMVQNKDWRFVTIEISEQHNQAAARIRQIATLLHNKIYDPNRDVIITPTNGFEMTSPGYTLGQDPMNRELVLKLNQDSPRYVIDGGRVRQNFAVGDKVMATVNDYDAGITNGMTGLITGIAENGAYIGDTRRWGLVDEVNEYFETLDEDLDDSGVDFNLEEMVEDSQLGLEELKKREKGERGPSSHIITVQFGEGDHAFSIDFDSKAKVGSLMLAYVATCHKMQGGECPLVFVICHQANKRMLTREWLYTAITRASQRCVIFYTTQGFGFALGKQAIKGTTLKQKIAVFNELGRVGPLGATVNFRLPKARSLVEGVSHVPSTQQESRPSAPQVEREQGDEARQNTALRATQINIKNLTINITQKPESAPVFDGAKDAERSTVDGGRLQAETAKPLPIPQPVRYVSQRGAVLMLQKLTAPEPLALPHFDSLPDNAGTGWVFEFGDYPPTDPTTNITPDAPLLSAIRAENKEPPPEPIKPRTGPLSLAALLAVNKLKKG